MRRAAGRLLAAGAVALVSGTVALATGTSSLDTDVKNALTTIDTIPTKQQIDNAYGSADPVASLTSLATTNDPSDDGVAIRLRAIHALAKYCTTMPCNSGDVAHQAVASVIPATRDATSGSPVLLLRAAIETLGIMRVPSDAATLVPLLDHPSRDIRAATARALRDLCNTQAITPLRTRYSSEMTDQVKLAISEALRILGQCSQGS